VSSLWRRANPSRNKLAPEAIPRENRGRAEEREPGAPRIEAGDEIEEPEAPAGNPDGKGYLERQLPLEHPHEQPVDGVEREARDREARTDEIRGALAVVAEVAREVGEEDVVRAVVGRQVGHDPQRQHGGERGCGE
jgi:hypothetical protein